MNIRKFYLENEIGERKSLNGDIFLQNPAGLGVSLDPSFANIGMGFFTNITDEEEPQMPVLGDLVLKKKAYAEYKAFVDWIIAAEKLFLIYNPAGNAEYFRQVDLAYITKTELGVGRWLTAPVAFSPLTPWYLPRPLVLTMETATAAMRFSFRMDNVLRFPNAGLGNFTVELQNSGHIPAAIRFEFSGSVESPKLDLTDAVSSEVYGSCRIDTSTEAGEVLIISTEYLQPKAEKISLGGSHTDLLDFLDVSNDPFFRVPPGRLCRLRFSSASESPITGAANAKIYEYFRTV